MTETRDHAGSVFGARRIRWPRAFLALFVTLTLAGWLLSQIAPTNILRMLQSLSWSWALVGVGCYLGVNLVRAARFRVLLETDLASPQPYLPSSDDSHPGEGVTEHPRESKQLEYRFSRLLRITFVHSMLTALVGRAGELGFLYLASTRLGLGLASGAAVIVFARILDYLVVATGFVVAIGATRAVPTSSVAQDLVLLSALLLFAGLALVMAIPRGLRTVSRWSAITPAHTVAHRLTGATQTLSTALVRFRHPSIWIPATAWSAVLWILTFAWMYAFLSALGVNTSPHVFVIGATFAVLSRALPPVSVAGLGAHEAGWTAGFLLVGFDRETAIATGFAVNALAVLSALVFGLPMLLSVLPRSTVR